jgi:ABC-type lipoprotein export system ATPase subunit
MNILKAKNIKKSYTTGQVTTEVLKGISLDIKQGEFISITGRSGSGKSTLLYILSLLDRPTSGEVDFQGCDTITFSKDKEAQCRLENFGFIFQNHALLPELTALENVMLPEMVRFDNWKRVRQKSIDILEKVGLGERLNNHPSQLSGGEKQRVAVARAIANEPDILFADEPTASLDSKRADEIIDLICKANKEGITVILVTHGEKYTRKADRVIELKDGKIIE